MTDLQLEEFITRIASESGESGANTALSKLGLADENAGPDLKAIRGLLSGYRVIRASATQSAVKGFGKMLGWACVIVSLYVLGHFFPDTTKRIAERMVEP